MCRGNDISGSSQEEKEQCVSYGDITAYKINARKLENGDASEDNIRGDAANASPVITSDVVVASGLAVAIVRALAIRFTKSGVHATYNWCAQAWVR